MVTMVGPPPYILKKNFHAAGDSFLNKAPSTKVTLSPLTWSSCVLSTGPGGSTSTEGGRAEEDDSCTERKYQCYNII